MVQVHHIVSVVLAAGGRPILTFRYRDRLRRLNGAWKFTERFAQIDEPSEP